MFKTNKKEVNMIKNKVMVSRQDGKDKVVENIYLSSQEIKIDI